MKHVMVDLETFGTDSDAVVVSFGAARFNPQEGGITDVMYFAIDATDQIEAGRKIDLGTVKWWLQQENKAREDVSGGGISTAEFLVKLNSWWPKKAKFWSHITFDFIIMNSLYNSFNIQTPWHYRDGLDIRTLMAISKMMGKEIEPMEREGTHHRAIDDAIFQAKYVMRTMKQITS